MIQDNFKIGRVITAAPLACKFVYDMNTITSNFYTVMRLHLGPKNDSILGTHKYIFLTAEHNAYLHRWKIQWSVW